MLTFMSPRSRTVMAASGLARSKGVTGVTATYVSFLILILLLLVSISGSLMDKGQLEELRENVQKLQQEALRRKAESKLDRTYIPEILEAAPHVMDSLLELLKTDLAPVLNFPPMLDAIDDIKTFLKELKKFIDKYLETTAAEIKDYEEKLSVVMERLRHLEEHKDEL